MKRLYLNSDCLEEKYKYMNKNGRLMRGIVFVCIGFLLFVFLQKVTISKVNLFTMSALKEFQDSEDEFDVLFVGTSHMAYGVSPMRMYEQRGLSSYNLATEAQTIALSYSVLLRAFSFQKPKVVVLDASSLFAGETGHDAAWQTVLDSIPFSADKIKMAGEYEENLNIENGKFNMMIPMMQYHTRWKSLENKDFMYCFNKRKSYTKGYMMFSSVIDSGYDTEEMNRIHNYVIENTQEQRENYKGEVFIAENPIYANEISEHNIIYLLRIKELCEQNGAKLLVTKVPSVNMPTIYLAAWTSEKYLMTKQLCEENHIEYFDLLYESDVNIDWRQDSIDGGNHLNIKGAYKATNVLANYLVESGQVCSKRNTQFEEDMPIYKKIEEVALLGAETNFAQELELYNNHSSDWIMMMAVKKNCSGYVSDEVQREFYNMNLKVDLNEIVNQSYLAIIDDKQVKEELYSNRKVTHTYEDVNGITYSATSAGYFSDQQGLFTVDGKNYTLSGEGINVIIYDKESKNIVDRFWVDTGNENPQVSRNINETAGIVRQYEQYYSIYAD